MTAVTFTTSNLVAPLTWAISSGTLPTGLSFNTSNGSITGTPSEVIAAPGRQVIVRATDVGGLQGFSTVTFQINPAPRLYEFTTATFSNAGLQGRTGPNITQARSGVGNPVWAPTYLNMTVNGIQDWTVPETGSYQITCLGARGGQAGQNSGGWGFGARAIGTFSFTQGEVLRLVVGQRGNTTNARASTGGGGASAVWRRDSNAEPLIMAGGGGGASDQPEGQAGVGGTRHARVHAVIGTSGEGSTQDGGSVRNAGGSGGNGGSTSGSPSAGAGAGFKGDGDSNGAGDRSGKQIRTDARGGAGGSDGNRVGNGSGDPASQGGFGGGGGGEGWYGCSGGGGGYSGGGASNDGPRTAGGGGGSYNAGTNQTMNAAFNNATGSITITRL
jgi:hypothetical protein